jgi:Ca-activated chloride channel family protein
VPDVFAERPVVVFGKWRGKPEGTITLSGLSGLSKKWENRIDAASARPLPDNSALRYLWARSRVTQLSDYNKLETTDERVREITALGITYNLLTAYTSFVAVDKQVRREGGDSVTVKQPLPLPQGVSDNALPASPSYTMAMSNPKMARGSFGSSFLGGAGAAPAPTLRADTASGAANRQANLAKQSESAQVEKGTQETFEIRNLKVEGGLSEETVRQVIEKNLHLIRQCFGERATQSQLTIEWTIDKNGSVTNVHTAAGGGFDKTDLNCIAGQVAGWRFPASQNGGKVHVKVTVASKSQRQ